MTRDEVRDALLEAIAEGLRRRYPGAIVEAVFVGDDDASADGRVSAGVPAAPAALDDDPGLDQAQGTQ
jgi:uncharacterized iron-regulated membrane protein